MCPTSNVHTGAAESIETHPIDLLRRLRFRVTLNTDNRLMSGTTLTDEYVHAAEQLGFTIDELAGIALNGFESAFLPWEERLMLIEEVSDTIDELIGLDA
jgi:adenosine deaminase